MNNPNILTMGTRSKFTTEVVVYHGPKELDATDVVRHIQMLKVQDPNVPFTLDNPDMAEFLEEYHLIKADGSSGYVVDHENANKREQILDIVCNHIDQSFKKCQETYPNGKITVHE